MKAIEAVMDGFNVMPMAQAAEKGDIFVTVTGCENVIVPEHFIKMKDGAICCNAGHFDCEVAVAELEKMAQESWEARENIRGYRLANGNRIYILAQGRLVNLASGDGHPAEIMDMSFAIQALGAEYIAKNGRDIKEKIVNVPQQVDDTVARMKLSAWGTSIDTLTPEQREYLYGVK